MYFVSEMNLNKFGVFDDSLLIRSDDDLVGIFIFWVKNIFEPVEIYGDIVGFIEFEGDFGNLFRDDLYLNEFEKIWIHDILIIWWVFIIGFL